MLKQRIVSAALGIPLIISVAYLGGIWFKLGISLIILIGMYEYAKMIKHQGWAVFTLVYIGSIIILTCLYWKGNINGEVILFLLLIHVFFLIGSKIPWEELALVFSGIIFFTWTLAHLILIRETFPEGFNYIFLCFIITWSTDTGAYFCGRLFGRHKLIPTISPNKTVEGAIGGIVICVLAVFLLNKLIFHLPSIVLLVLAISASLVGQMGDLMASALKRWAGVKDSGNIIPGHGGILDRFDSLTLVSPLVFYALKPILLI